MGQTHRKLWKWLMEHSSQGKKRYDHPTRVHLILYCRKISVMGFQEPEGSYSNKISLSFPFSFPKILFTLGTHWMKRKPFLQGKGTCNTSVIINGNDFLSFSPKISVAINLGNCTLGKEKYPNISGTSTYRVRVETQRTKVSSWLPIIMEACEFQLQIESWPMLSLL